MEHVHFLKFVIALSAGSGFLFGCQTQSPTESLSGGSSVSATRAAEDHCTITTRAELKEKLVQFSPFKGPWRGDGRVGQTIQSFNELAGIFYVKAWATSYGKLNKLPHQFLVTIPRVDKVQYGRTWFVLRPDCNIEGSYDRNIFEKFHMDLSPAGPIIDPIPEADPKFGTTEKLIDYLVEESHFSGQWKWYDLRENISFSFGRGNDHSVIGTFEQRTEDGTVIEGAIDQINIQSSTIIRLRYGASKNARLTHLEAQPDGSLHGIQIHGTQVQSGEDALVVVVAPSGSQ